MKRTLTLLLLLALVAAPALAKDEKEEDHGFNAGAFSALGFRLLGPSFTSGRVGDFAVNPDDPAEYYVAVCSGGVWKTTNGGITYAPIFDGEGSYSIGCLALDPGDPKVLWVGTGENNSQRSVSYGDGVYKSVDGGRNFEMMGLEDSEHVGMIAIDPRDSDVVYVAAQGPLWRAGDDRGLYRTTDGGATWEKILEVDDDTGVSEIHLDPRDPDTMYAVTYQRRRHVWTLLNGGPGSGVHKSVDGGATWRRIQRGLPGVELGRIGLDIAPSDPDVLYAIVEAALGEGGFYRSDDAGENWTRMSDHVSTSPQYYQEILVDPQDPDLVWSLNTWLMYTEDGGESWERASTSAKHVDDHAMWIDPADPRHILVGSDGGIYESWDRGAVWGFHAALPVTQFYKVHVDYDEPFYWIYGGTQDNNSLGAPHRTVNVHGVRNTDWRITQGGDGFETQVDPTDANIVYSQYQHGGLARYDRRNGEGVDIQPQPAWGDEAYRFNWNSPLLISPHDHARLYFGCQKLLRSDDMGSSWREISHDLSRNLDRNELEIMGKVWSVDAVSKNRSTSYYGSLISLDESTLREGLIYVGTDDGLIQVTRDGGATWTRHEKFKGVPDMSYVGDIKASRFDEATVFACFDNHKKGDFKPYLLRSEDYGKSWRSIAGDLPERGTVHAVQQDHVNPDLLFAGTEFGAFFTVDGGEHWLQLKSGLPTIAVRDLDLQRRENDVALATFGRGLYVLDDYSPLRHVSPERFENEDAILFPVRDAWLYHEATPMGGRAKGSQGDGFWQADNPPHGAVITYWLKDKSKTIAEQRREREKEAQETEKAIRYPSWEELRAEDREREPAVVLTIVDTDGKVVRRVMASNAPGLHRVTWDLHDPSLRPAGTSLGDRSGPLVSPGVYTASLARVVDEVATPLGEPQTFTCKPLGEATLPAASRREVSDFHRRCAELQRAVIGASRFADELQERIDHLRVAVFNTTSAGEDVATELRKIELRLLDLLIELEGDDTISNRSEPTPPSLSRRIGRVVWGSWESTAAPTVTHRESYTVVATHFPRVQHGLRDIDADLMEIESLLEAMGAPWTPGRTPVWRADK